MSKTILVTGASSGFGFSASSNWLDLPQPAP